MEELNIVPGLGGGRWYRQRRNGTGSGDIQSTAATIAKPRHGTTKDYNVERQGMRYTMIPVADET